MKIHEVDYLIVGAGVNGLFLAWELKRKYPDARIAVLDKEPDVAMHASGNCSGNLHAGFFFTADQFKINLVKEGNQLLKEYINKHKLPLNNKPAILLATSDKDAQHLEQLYQRAIANDIPVSLITSTELQKLEPRANTHKYALVSYTNAATSAKAVCNQIKEELQKHDVKFYLNTQVIKLLREDQIITNNGCEIRFNRLINCTGLYVDRIAHLFNLASEYRIISLRGVYLQDQKGQNKFNYSLYKPINTNEMFLGTHLVTDVDEIATIGAIAYPALWRENYRGINNFSFKEFCESILLYGRLILSNPDIREFMFKEIKKYKQSNLNRYFEPMLQENIDSKHFKQQRVGIIPKLVNLKSKKVINELTIAQDNHSFHLLNGVIHGFTVSPALAKYLVNEYKL